MNDIIELTKRIKILEDSCFTDMKNELIAFKIERNELRKRLESLESIINKSEETK